MLEQSKKIGRKKKGRHFDSPRSPVDFKRICKKLGFGAVPPNISEPSLIDLWNDNTDYYLPRMEDRRKPLLVISKSLIARAAEVELWRKVGIL